MSVWSDVRDDLVRTEAKRRGVTLEDPNRPWPSPTGPNPLTPDQIDSLAAYFDTHRLEIGGALLAGGLAYIARNNPDVLKALIEGATITIGNVLDVPGELTNIGGN